MGQCPKSQRPSQQESNHQFTGNAPHEPAEGDQGHTELWRDSTGPSFDGMHPYRPLGPLRDPGSKSIGDKKDNHKNPEGQTCRKVVHGLDRSFPGNRSYDKVRVLLNERNSHAEKKGCHARHRGTDKQIRSKPGIENGRQAPTMGVRS